MFPRHPRAGSAPLVLHDRSGGFDRTPGSTLSTCRMSFEGWSVNEIAKQSLETSRLFSGSATDEILKAIRKVRERSPGRRIRRQRRSKGSRIWPHCLRASSGVNVRLGASCSWRALLPEFACWICRQPKRHDPAQCAGIERSSQREMLVELPRILCNGLARRIKGVGPCANRKPFWPFRLTCHRGEVKTPTDG